MNKLAAALAATFLIGGVVSGFALYQTAARYDTATDALLKLGPHMISVKEVRIPPIHSMNESVSVWVEFNVTNPTRTAIRVFSISFDLYNDDINVPGELPEKLNTRYVYLGAALGPEPATLLEPGDTVTMQATVIVGGIVGNIGVLSTTDDEGNYHPFFTARMLVEIVDFGIKQDIRGVYFASGPEGRGVPPYEG